MSKFVGRQMRAPANKNRVIGGFLLEKMMLLPPVYGYQEVKDRPMKVKTPASFKSEEDLARRTTPPWTDCMTAWENRLLHIQYFR